MLFHLLVVFILTGIWHGTGSNYIVWGLFHAALVIIERQVIDRNWYKKIPDWIKWLCTIISVFFSWILFFSKDLAAALQYYRNMFVPATTGPINFTWRYYLSKKILLLLIISVVVQLPGIEIIRSRAQSFADSNIGNVIKKAALLLLFVIDIFYIVNSSYSPFIYFQF